MLPVMILIYLLANLCWTVILAEPLILSEYYTACRFHKESTPENFTLYDDLQTIQSRNVQVFLKFCTPLPRNITCKTQSTSQVCVLNTNEHKSHNYGSSFIAAENPDEDYDLESVGGDKCSNTTHYRILVKFSCSDHKITSKLVEGPDDCSYEIQMMNPNCQAKCTARFHNQLIDLRRFRSSLNIKSEDRQFFLTLCGSDTTCRKAGKAGANACEVTAKNQTFEISSTSNQHVDYNVDKQELSVRGKFRTSRRNQRILVVLIKCNWNVANYSNAVYNKVEPQGKNYEFEIESSFGCIKAPQDCVLYDTTYKYNFSRLNNPRGFWRVSNTTKNMYINLCGPLKLPQSQRQKNACEDTFSQICDVNNKEFVNKGSIPRMFQMNNDQRVELQIVDGVKCKEIPAKSYETKIVFECSKSEEGPKLVQSANCTTNLVWKTPTACPTQEANRCLYYKPKVQTNCTYQNDDDKKQINLSRLKLSNNKNFMVKDGHFEYELNPCGPVIVSEMPCMKDSAVVMRKVDEPNIHKRIFSLGKFKQFKFLDDNNMILESSFGTLCEDDGGGEDYSSTIHFQCSSEEKIQLLKKENCLYEFLWKTRYVCGAEYLPPKTTTTTTTESAKSFKQGIFLSDGVPEVRPNCSVASPITGAKFDISGLNSTNFPIGKKCPVIIFVTETKTIELQYYTQIKCIYFNTVDYYYSIYLKCSKETKELRSVKKQNCSESLEYEHQEICNFFVEKTTTTESTTKIAATSKSLETLIHLNTSLRASLDRLNTSSNLNESKYLNTFKDADTSSKLSVATISLISAGVAVGVLLLLVVSIYVILKKKICRREIVSTDYSYVKNRDL